MSIIPKNYTDVIWNKFLKISTQLCSVNISGQIFVHRIQVLKGSGGLMDKVSVSQPPDHGFKPHMGHDHDSSYDTSTGWFHEVDSRVINISCYNLFHN